MDVMGYIVQEGLILIPALLIIGMMIKKIPNIQNWTIPFILLVPGVGGTIAILGWSAQAIIQGILITGAAVYGNQIWKQILYAKEDDEEPSEDTTE